MAKESESRRMCGIWQTQIKHSAGHVKKRKEKKEMLHLHTEDVVKQNGQSKKNWFSENH